MNKQITELKPNEIKTVVGGVAYAVTASAVQMSASVYQAPTVVVSRTQLADLKTRLAAHA